MTKIWNVLHYRVFQHLTRKILKSNTIQRVNVSKVITNENFCLQTGGKEYEVFADWGGCNSPFTFSFGR